MAIDLSLSKQLDLQRRLLAANGGQWFDFEGLVRDIYLAFLRPGDVSLDVGVNRGDHFLQMLKAVGKDGYVVGVEASKSMVELTKSFAKTAGFDESRWIIHQVAASDHQGIAQFSFVVDQPGLSSLAERDVAKGYVVEKTEVVANTLNLLLSTVTKPVAFAKIDVEGGEYHALLGGSRLFSDRSPIIFEFDADSPRYFGFEISDFRNLFDANGYEVFDFFGNKITADDHFAQSLVWNYFAGPIGIFEKVGVRSIVARSLAKIGITL